MQHLPPLWLCPHYQVFGCSNCSKQTIWFLKPWVPTKMRKPTEGHHNCNLSNVLVLGSTMLTPLSNNYHKKKKQWSIYVKYSNGYHLSFGQPTNRLIEWQLAIISIISSVSLKKKNILAIHFVPTVKHWLQIAPTGSTKHNLLRSSTVNLVIKHSKCYL